MERKVARDIALEALERIVKDCEPDELLSLSREVVGIVLTESEILSAEHRRGEKGRNRMATGGRNRGSK